MTTNYIQLKGISGAGKGSRVSTLMLFLQSKFKYEPYNVEIKVHGAMTKITVGIYFPDLNTVFTGKWVKSNKSKLYSWTGLDWFNSALGGWSIKEMLIKSKAHNIIVEGYPMTLSGMYRAEAVLNEYGYDRALFQYFDYDNLEQVQGRMMERSGKRIKGTCWGTNKGFMKEGQDQLKEMAQRGQDKLYVELHKFDAPITVFGEMFFKEVIKDPTLLDEFMEFTKTTTSMRHVSKLAENHQQFQHLIDEQKRTYVRTTIPTSTDSVPN
jgi:hypothetical protein